MCKIVGFSFARVFSSFINECVHFDVPKTIFTQEQTPKTKLYAGLDNIFSCLRAKFKMCLQKHILFRFCDLNIVKMSVF